MLIFEDLADPHPVAFAAPVYLRQHRDNGRLLRVFPGQPVMYSPDCSRLCCSVTFFVSAMIEVTIERTSLALFSSCSCPVKTQRRLGSTLKAGLGASRSLQMSHPGCVRNFRRPAPAVITLPQLVFRIALCLCTRLCSWRRARVL